MHNTSKGITFVAGITKTKGAQQSWNSFNERLMHFGAFFVQFPDLAYLLTPLLTIESLY